MGFALSEPPFAVASCRRQAITSDQNAIAEFALS